MKKLLNYGFAVSAIAGLAVIGVTTSSDARSVPALIGQPQAPGDYSCFTNNNGAVTNNCSTAKQFCMALPVDDSPHTLAIVVFAPNITHNVACFGQANFNDSSIAGFTGTRSPGIFGSSQILSFPTLSVPGLGNLLACCNLSPTSRIESINY